MSKLGSQLRMALITAAVALGMAGAARQAYAQKAIDPAHAFAWEENCGWTNWGWGAGGAAGRVQVFSTCITGKVWFENAGWLSLASNLGGAPAQGHHFNNTTD